MTDKFQDLDLDTLKASLEEKKVQLELLETGDNAKVLYKELKALQYEISMRGARAGATPSESPAQRASA